MKKILAQLSVSAVGAMLLFGCAAPQPAVKYVSPGAQGGVAGTGIESQDIGAAAQKAAASILNLPQIQQAAQPPTIVILPVANRSTATVDTELYTTKLRGILMQYGGGKVRFLARDVSWEANKQEQELRRSGEVQPGAARAALTYDYILTAEVRGISAASSAGRSEYYLVAFKLVDMNDLLVWEDQYEVKKEGREHIIYR